MAFETSVLRDGQWVTETVNVEAALRASMAQPVLEAPPAQPPSCGVMSKTIVESPIIRWVLPVLLRSKQHNDVAFVGTNYVQISEVDSEGQVHEVLRKDDFDVRIRNAVVLGQGLDHSIEEDGPEDLIKLEEPTQQSQEFSRSSESAGQTRHFPPQFLALILETGDLVFLFIRVRLDGQLEFVTARHRHVANLEFLGHEFSVDPSSRYLAAASVGGALVVYHLRSMSDLAAQYSREGTIDPIKSFRIRIVNAVIHKLEFLYPRPQDNYHIILLLYVVRRENLAPNPVSRLVVYDWEEGDSLEQVLAAEKVGIRLPEELTPPMLLIPLRFQSAFFFVSEDYIGIVKRVLSGSPIIETSHTAPPGPTELFHGLGNPLWTAWSRPFRRKKYFERTDIIFLAREDGAIIHVEIDSADVSPTVSNAGCVSANINTAFVATFDRFSDVLIIGGDSGPGGVWRLAPRKDLEQVAVIPNWSPVVDAATSTDLSSWDSPVEDSIVNSRKKRAVSTPISKPGIIYSTSGRGENGCIVEWRKGIQARIGLDIETEELIRHSWVFSSDEYPIEGLLVLLAVPQSTVALHFSEDLAQANALSAEETPFDLGSSTLCATCTPSRTVVQVTETAVTLIDNNAQSVRFQLADILSEGDLIGHEAFCSDNIIMVYTLQDQLSQLHTLKIEGLTVTHVSSWDPGHTVTSLSLFSHLQRQYAVASFILDDSPIVSIHFLDGTSVASITLDPTQEDGFVHGEAGDGGARLEALTSICMVGETRDGVHLIAGTRCGHVVTIRLSDETSPPVAWQAEKLGLMPVTVFAMNDDSQGGRAAFACCDNRAILMRNPDKGTYAFKTKDIIWPTDSNDSSIAPPAVHSLHNLRHSLYREPGHMSLLLIAGSRMLFTDVWPQSTAVPRCIPVGGTPTRVLYSKAWQCLVVGLSRHGQTTLAFIDPKSGESVATPTDQDKKPRDFISGLGFRNDKIYGLYEWLYVKDGRTFAFIVVTTKGGHLLVVSLEAAESQPTSTFPLGQLRYWTRLKEKFNMPIMAIAGSADGILFSVGNVLHWYVVDLVEKRLKPVKKLAMGSTVTALRMSEGKIFALTAKESLQVVDHQAEWSESGIDRVGNTRERSSTMAVLHSDSVARSAMHMIDVGDATDNVTKWPIMLVSDAMCGIAGVWADWGWRNQPCKVIFEGVLPVTVRRFLRVRSRPPWTTQQRAKYQCLPSATNGAEILGVAVGGSLQHFTLLGVDLWRFLYFVQQLARRNATLCPFTHMKECRIADFDDMQSDLDPKDKHIDGDLLQRCLDQRGLETLVSAGDGYIKFRSCLDVLTNGAIANSISYSGGEGSARNSEYFALGYDILEFLLEPVL
ncbi:thermotolerance protein [Stachybotrys elegans]|uniref:Thermotolerance protein n=1 Tax=Stachybotrys elegans TaxID=80388 RepID=A0A8K0T0B3_9HYPO|nr:thermotolerance protein [Stachybotrys elegans]